MAVARFESTFLMPILARMAVKAAKMADRSAYPTQDIGQVYTTLLLFFNLGRIVAISSSIPSWVLAERKTDG